MFPCSSKPLIYWRVSLLEDVVYRYTHEYRSSCNMRKNQPTDGLVILVVYFYVIIFSCFCRIVFYLIISPIFDLMSSEFCFFHCSLLFFVLLYLLFVFSYSFKAINYFRQTSKYRWSLAWREIDKQLLGFSLDLSEDSGSKCFSSISYVYLFIP